MDESGKRKETDVLGEIIRQSDLPPGQIAASWLAAIIESADDAIVSKTLEGVITSWNKGAERIFGYTPDEAIGKPVRMLIPDELQSEEDLILGQIKSGRRIEHYETVRIHKDGHLVNVSLTVSPIKTNDGGIIGASKIARDITERKEYERKLQELLERERHARSQAEGASRSKDDFLGLLSHELRTPLNAILGWSKILNSTEPDPDALRSGLAAIERTARVQASLIDDMLDVSRIMSGKLRLDAQPVDPTSVISAAVETMRPAADAKGINLYVVLSYGAGMVLGDPVRLQQVVVNLLSNAVKFTPRGGSVRVSMEKIDSLIVLTVSDNGPGINSALLPFVFDRFRQGDSSTTKEYGGLGLGLAIVRQLVELHGGTVAAANLEDGGATFTVTLPIMPARKPAENLHDGDDGVGAQSSVARFAAEADLSGVKVLVVDDDADSREMLNVLLTQCGAEVQTAASASIAFEIIERDAPDVLVSDVGMPEEDGYSFIRKVREMAGPERRIPAVALTAYARVEDRLQALSAGFNMHVPKPVDLAELVTVIVSVLDRSED